MTEEEKAIELLKQEPDYSLSYYERENAIDIVLNLIQKKDTEINKLNNVIDRMAEVLNNQDLDYLDLCDGCKNNNEECYGDYCKERIKEYFMKE